MRQSEMGYFADYSVGALLICFFAGSMRAWKRHKAVCRRSVQHYEGSGRWMKHRKIKEEFEMVLLE